MCLAHTHGIVREVDIAVVACIDINGEWPQGSRTMECLQKSGNCQLGLPPKRRGMEDLYFGIVVVFGPLGPADALLMAFASGVSLEKQLTFACMCG